GYDAVKNGVLERLTRAMEENAYPLEQAARAAGGAAHPASPVGRPAEPFAAVSSKA
ncbi:MAG TPA: phosphate acyltransferase, partial [Trinickia sp.]|nr:phosphate acyltransferase [Trinickia sp.]